jgi:hypothetical protein
MGLCGGKGTVTTDRPFLCVKQGPRCLGQSCGDRDTLGAPRVSDTLTSYVPLCPVTLRLLWALELPGPRKAEGSGVSQATFPLRTML